MNILHTAIDSYLSSTPDVVRFELGTEPLELLYVTRTFALHSVCFSDTGIQMNITSRSNISGYYELLQNLDLWEDVEDHLIPVHNYMVSLEGSDDPSSDLNILRGLIAYLKTNLPVNWFPLEDLDSEGIESTVLTGTLSGDTPCAICIDICTGGTYDLAQGSIVYSNPESDIDTWRDLIDRYDLLTSAAYLKDSGAEDAQILLLLNWCNATLKQDASKKRSMMLRRPAHTTPEGD